MQKNRKRIFTWILLFTVSIQVFWWDGISVSAEPAAIEAPSAVLLESSTGKVIFEQNARERRSPASITKIMTLLLTFEALDQGKIKLEDPVTVSAYASSMGGSQVFLAENEVQTLETMIKCIAVASGNDASVAVAEYIAGSEEAFVDQMNQKAAELGMVDTHFEDCCGLTDSDGHYTTAMDVAIMSRELTVKYPQVFEYTGIWMEDIIHETRLCPCFIYSRLFSNFYRIKLLRHLHLLVWNSAIYHIFIGMSITFMIFYYFLLFSFYDFIAFRYYHSTNIYALLTSTIQFRFSNCLISDYNILYHTQKLVFLFPLRSHQPFVNHFHKRYKAYYIQLIYSIYCRTFFSLLAQQFLIEFPFALRDYYIVH